MKQQKETKKPKVTKAENVKTNAHTDKKLKIKPTAVVYTKNQSDLVTIQNVKSSLSIRKGPQNNDSMKSGKYNSRLDQNSNRTSPNDFISPRNVRAINSAMAEHSVFAGKNVNQVNRTINFQKTEFKKKSSPALPIAKKSNYLNSFTSFKTVPKKANMVVKSQNYNNSIKQFKQKQEKVQHQNAQNIGKRLEGKQLFSEESDHEEYNSREVIAQPQGPQEPKDDLCALFQQTTQNSLEDENIVVTQRLSNLSNRRSSLVRKSIDSGIKGSLNGSFHKMNQQILQENDEEDSENLSNVSDDELFHNTKIDESLQTIDPSKEMRRNFGQAISNIKGVSQKRQSILPPSKAENNSVKPQIKLQDVKKQVLEQDIDDDYKFAQMRNKFGNIEQQETPKKSDQDDGILLTENMQEMTSERNPLDSMQKVRKSVHKTPNMNINPISSVYDKIVSMSTISIDGKALKLSRHPQDKPVGYSVDKQYYDQQFSNNQSQNFNQRALLPNFQEEDFDQDEIMENLDGPSDNLEETKNLMQSLDRASLNDEFAQSHSEYIKRKLIFTQNSQDDQKILQSLVQTQKVNFNNIFKINQAATRQNELESQYFSIQYEDKNNEESNEIPSKMQTLDGPLKRDNRINSMIAGLRPSITNNSFKDKPRSQFLEKKGSVNQVKDMSMSRSTYKKKSYTMDLKSTQVEMKIIQKDIKFVTVNMLNPNLRIINLSGNKIQNLPDEICDLFQLIELFVQNNNIKHLPEDIGQLQRLKMINASHNDMKFIPESLSQCKQIVNVTVTDNKIEQLPRNIGNCNKLQTLLLQNNAIHSVPKSLGDLNQLMQLSFEWFQYFDPPQSVHQSGAPGKFVISMLKEFCKSNMQIQGNLLKGLQKSFSQFIVYFYISKPQKKIDLTAVEIISCINSLRFTIKKRCLTQTICSNRHTHLLIDVINTKSNCVISDLINRNIDLNIQDVNDQAPLLCSLRQPQSDYAKILFQSKSVHPLNLNKISIKHGYPLHISILTEKFDIALDILNNPNCDPKVLNTIGANVVHLLFVKYDKDPTLCLKILNRCISLGVDVNLVDQINAAPIHIALRKKQYQAIKDIVNLNKLHQKQLFNLNITDKRGQTPMHFAVEKQDHEIFRALINDPYLDVNTVDTEDFYKARRLSVIFSAFHKILYRQEKSIMRNQFAKDLADHYVDFVTMEPVRNIIEQRKRGADPAPISVKNKAKKSVDFTKSVSIERSPWRPQSPTSSNNEQSPHKEQSQIKYVDMNDHQTFYDELNDETKFVQSHVLNFRDLRKKRKLEKEQQLAKSKEVSQSSKANYPMIRQGQEQRGRYFQQSNNITKTALDVRSMSIMSKVSQSSNIMQVNSQSQYFKSDKGSKIHQRQKSMQNYNDASSQYNKFGPYQDNNMKHQFMSVTGQRENNFLDSDGNTSDYNKVDGFEMNIQNYNISDEDIAQEEEEDDLSNIDDDEFELDNQSINVINQLNNHSEINSNSLIAKQQALTTSARQLQKMMAESKNQRNVKTIYQPLGIQIDSSSNDSYSKRNYSSNDPRSKFGPRPQNYQTQNQTEKPQAPPSTSNKSGYHGNIDDIQFEIPLTTSKSQLPKVEDEKRKNKDGDGEKSQTKIYISNLNINLNNVFINLQDVSIPSTPSDRQNKGSSSYANRKKAADIGQMVRNNIQQSRESNRKRAKNNF